MDGLLLDTESAYTVAQQRILDRFSRTFTWELKAKMMGRQALEGAQVLLDALELGPEEITAQPPLSLLTANSPIHPLFRAR
ncbi:Pseudouridine-5'-monophosphatase [Tetrabaena socialis]|uniref:Pseudouridine-5'-monophosphatase n=1 Tax=Tetrabaena socialis TaxID=47790 RepID=A0A2J8AI25_9CHLO|nr:Pseudouridine-5'-monophosphatase [Tetrabaena socialis]|eukprot:PNH12160.1 Pseudouridine-5'-monophosphatase [Tetrabaena socialis]